MTVSHARLRVLFAFFAIASLLLGGKLAYWQVAMRAELLGQALGQVRSDEVVAATRGVIHSLNLPDGCLAGVGAFDVLEHVTNRQDFLQEILRVLVPGGHFIVTVPALQPLWSHADVEAGHYLRYSRRTLRKELGMYGFEVLSLGYFFALTVPPLLLIRALPYRLGLRVSDSNNSALRASGGILGKLAGRIEIAWAGHVPFGSSLLAVARKPSQSN